MTNHTITVSLIDGKHVCQPTETTVNPGDTVTWSSTQVVIVSFKNQTPFKEGLGPFKPGDPETVAVNKHGRFHPEIQLDGKDRPTVGDLIVP